MAPVGLDRCKHHLPISFARRPSSGDRDPQVPVVHQRSKQILHPSCSISGILLVPSRQYPVNSSRAATSLPIAESAEPCMFLPGHSFASSRPKTLTKAIFPWALSLPGVFPVLETRPVTSMMSSAIWKAVPRWSPNPAKSRLPRAPLPKDGPRLDAGARAAAVLDLATVQGCSSSGRCSRGPCRDLAPRIPKGPAASMSTPRASRME